MLRNSSFLFLFLDMDASLNKRIFIARDAVSQHVIGHVCTDKRPAPPQSALIALRVLCQQTLNIVLQFDLACMKSDHTLPDFLPGIRYILIAIGDLSI